MIRKLNFLVLVTTTNCVFTLAQTAQLILAEARVSGQETELEVTTREFYPEEDETILFQWAADRDFTVEAETYHTSRVRVTLYDLSEGEYYARAIINASDGAPKSQWSNVVRFEIRAQTPVRPELLLLEPQPVTSDEATLSWHPSSDAVIMWKLQQSPVPDFPEQETITTELAGQVTLSSIDLTGLEGEGVLFFRIRDDIDELWSDPLTVRYQRPIKKRYSIAHVPRASVWETWLTLHAPDGAEVSLIWERDSDLGDTGTTVLRLPSLEPGDFIEARLSDEIRGAPVMVESNAPIAAAVIYRSPWGDSTTTVSQLRLHHRRVIAGIPEGGETMSALVIANHGPEQAVANLKLILTDGNGEYQNSYRVSLNVPAHGNRVMLLADLIPSPEEGLVQWITIEQESTSSWLDLLGATFNHGVPHWRQSAPLD